MMPTSTEAPRSVSDSGSGSSISQRTTVQLTDEQKRIMRRTSVKANEILQSFGKHRPDPNDLFYPLDTRQLEEAYHSTEATPDSREAVVLAMTDRYTDYARKIMPRIFLVSASRYRDKSMGDKLDLAFEYGLSIDDDERAVEELESRFVKDGGVLQYTDKGSHVMTLQCTLGVLSTLHEAHPDQPYRLPYPSRLPESLPVGVHLLAHGIVELSEVVNRTKGQSICSDMENLLWQARHELHSKWDNLVGVASPVRDAEEDHSGLDGIKNSVADSSRAGTLRTCDTQTTLDKGLPAPSYDQMVDHLNELGFHLNHTRMKVPSYACSDNATDDG